MNVWIVQQAGFVRRRQYQALLAALVLAAGFVVPLQAQDASNYQTVGSVAAYLGIIPAEIVGGRLSGSPETRMHGGPPGNAHSEHIVIALFENPSGTRIEDATVSATIAGLGDIGSTQIALKPMLAAGVVTYGGYMTFAGRDTYTIKLQISSPTSPAITKMSFVYEHGGT